MRMTLKSARLSLGLVLMGALTLRAQSGPSSIGREVSVQTHLGDGYDYSQDLSADQPDAFTQEYDEDVRTLEVVRTSRNLDQLEQTIERTSAKWKLKDRQYFQYYFQYYMYAACGVLSSYTVGDPTRQALLLNTLAMSELRSGDLSLADQARFVEFLSMDPPDITQEAWKRLRAEKAALWLATWQRIVASVVPGFDFADLPMVNVAPPDAAGLRAGISPDDVKDPRLRAEYEKAIAANSAKTIRFSEQYWLQQNAPPFRASAERYLVRAYSRPPNDLAELERLLVKHVNDAAVRKRILDAVK